MSYKTADLYKQPNTGCNKIVLLSQNGFATVLNGTESINNSFIIYKPIVREFNCVIAYVQYFICCITDFILIYFFVNIIYLITYLIIFSNYYFIFQRINNNLLFL